MSEKAAVPIADDRIDRMRIEAGEYHRHFSEVRTHTTSLFIPIALLGTIEIFKEYKDIPWVVPACFIVFVLVATTYINWVFWRWSLACRRLEEYYEGLLAHPAIPYDPKVHGFRTAFRRAAGYRPRLASQANKQNALAGSAASDETKNQSGPQHPLPEPVRPFDVGKWFRDPFLAGIIILGIVYLFGYCFIYAHTRSEAQQEALRKAVARTGELQLGGVNHSTLQGSSTMNGGAAVVTLRAGAGQDHIDVVLGPNQLEELGDWVQKSSAAMRNLPGQ